MSKTKNLHKYYLSVLEQFRQGRMLGDAVDFHLALVLQKSFKNRSTDDIENIITRYVELLNNHIEYESSWILMPSHIRLKLIKEALYETIKLLIEEPNKGDFCTDTEEEWTDDQFNYTN